MELVKGIIFGFLLMFLMYGVALLAFFVLDIILSIFFKSKK
jgi:hypothetical protein